MCISKKTIFLQHRLYNIYTRRYIVLRGRIIFLRNRQNYHVHTSIRRLYNIIYSYTFYNACDNNNIIITIDEFEVPFFFFPKAASKTLYAVLNNRLLILPRIVCACACIIYYVSVLPRKNKK